MNKFASSLLLFLFSALAVIFGFDLDQPPKQAEAKDRVVVSRVIDGDTIEVLFGTTTEKVRFIGIDTPERGECFFEESKAYLEKILEHKEVILVSDSTQANTDRYDRLLRYAIFPDGTNIAEELIRLGYGYEYTYNKPYLYQEAFVEAEGFALNHSLGLHFKCT